VIQPTLLSFKPPKIKIPDPTIDNKTTSTPIPEPKPPGINSKLSQNKNHSETEGKLSRRRDREEGPLGSVSYPTSPSPLPSRTRWTEERWREEYWRLTNKPPEEILKEASEFDDPKILILMDLIQDGVKYDRRNPKFRGREQYVIHPGSWHLLAQLVRILETKRRGGK